MQKMTLSTLDLSSCLQGKPFPGERTPWGRSDWMKHNVPAHSISNCPIHTFFRVPQLKQRNSLLPHFVQTRYQSAPTSLPPRPEPNKRFVILRRVAKEGGPTPYVCALQSRPFRVTLDAVSVVDPASELRGIDRDVQAPPPSPGRGLLGKSRGRQRRWWYKLPRAAGTPER